MYSHSFAELINQCTTFMLRALKEASEKAAEALEATGSTSSVKALRMIQLQKAIFAVGMFSLFESSLQDGLRCSDGFNEAEKILDDENELVLKERFGDLFLAINVLKHGHGRSYDDLVIRAKTLPFKVKLSGEAFFCEGDASEVSTLIEVDDAFLRLCSNVINDVSRVIRQVRPEFFS